MENTALKSVAEDIVSFADVFAEVCAEQQKIDANSRFNDLELLETIRKNSGAHYKSQFIAIAMGDRFFFEIKKDRVHTSWSVMAAKRFSPGRPKDLEAIIKKLVAKKKQFHLQLFNIQPMAVPANNSTL
jgi:hypothetical protein